MTANEAGAIPHRSASMPTFAVRPSSATVATPADPRLDRVLRRLLAWGLLAVLLLPAARGHNAWLGWMPLWLLGMPATAWWALHRFRLPAWPAVARQRRRRRAEPQARRRAQPARAAAAHLRAA
jgi:hypothetical protein